MKLSVKGKQIDVGDALRSHVETHLGEMINKYFSDSLDASVTFSREAHLFCADIAVHAGRGMTLQSRAEASEPYPAFDAAAAKLASRLRRHKTRLKDHHNDGARDRAEALIASAFVLHAEERDSDAEADDNPVVIAEMTTPIESLTVSEAVMRLDLGDLSALMFRNQSHGGLNMIYRRPDGNIGWVDPVEKRAAPRVAVQ